MTPSPDLPFPYDVDVLLKELQDAYPPRCILPKETPEEAHRYAGKVELIAELVEWKKETETGEA